jgi:hypothetical protein
LGWLGEVAPIEAGLAAAEQKLAAMRDLAYLPPGPHSRNPENIGWEG